MNRQPIHEAAGRGDYALVLRLGRLGRGWTQAQLARRVNMSRTVVSRFETGDRPLRDVETRRRLADALDLPVEVFGLSDRRGHKVGGIRSEGETDVRRRAFLLAAGAAVLSAEESVAQAGSLARPSVHALTDRIELALIHPSSGEVLGLEALPEVLKDARADYHATRYRSLADRLVSLVASAEAHAGQSPEVHSGLLTDVYTAIANLLFKLPASGLEWMAIDRAVRAARLTEDPFRIAESQRVLSTAYRRAGQPGHALDICTSVVDQLRRIGGPEWEMRTAHVLCTASYCAAKAADRDRALELLREARQRAMRAQISGRQWNEFKGPINVDVYAVSVGTALGDLGISFNAMRDVNLAALASAERRSRFLVDAATARLAADQPEQAVHTLLMAARIAPQAIATRPAAATLADAVRRVRPDLGRRLRTVGL